jgi:RNA:NAD 2'-phosphotransferase (TPT1/KptA family)
VGYCIEKASARITVISLDLIAVGLQDFTRTEENRVHSLFRQPLERTPIHSICRFQGFVELLLVGLVTKCGFHFFCSANGVWLTRKVPAEYIHFPEDSGS